MTDHWDALRAWLDAEQAKATVVARDEAAALMALSAAENITELQYVTAVRASERAAATVTALAGVARKMTEIEQGSGDD